MILISGGTGLVGGSLIARLLDDKKISTQETVDRDKPLITVLTRSPDRHRGNSSQENVSYLRWDSDQILTPESLQGTTAVIHLAGDPIAEGRWNTEKKQRIRDSRVIGTRCLVKSLAAMKQPPEVLISASAVGFYGHRPGESLTENSSAGSGFLPEVCQEWEAEAEAATRYGIRVCRIRIGIVMDSAGGALEKMLPFFKLGIGGTLGSGRQFFPWIHVNDLIGLLLSCMRDRQISGAVNAVAPTPTTNKMFTKALGQVLRRPTLLPVPKFGLKLLYGDFADSLFDSQQVLPQVALDAGYSFEFPEIQAALADLLST